MKIKIKKFLQYNSIRQLECIVHRQPARKHINQTGNSGTTTLPATTTGKEILSTLTKYRIYSSNLRSRVICECYFRGRNQCFRPISRVICESHFRSLGATAKLAYGSRKLHYTTSLPNFLSEVNCT